MIPFLTGCNVDRPYDGPKLKIEYSEAGEVIECTPDFLYQHAITDEVDSIYYIGDDLCIACQQLKPQLNAWCNVYKGAIYYIPISNITEDNMHFLIDATVGQHYEWSDKDPVPAVYFFMETNVLFRGDGENTMNYLNRYVEVLPNNG